MRSETIQNALMLIGTTLSPNDATIVSLTNGSKLYGFFETLMPVDENGKREMNGSL